MSFRKWEDFLEGKKMEPEPPTKAKEMKCDGDTSKQIVQGKTDKPPQGKGANPYHAPHAKNSSKQSLRVAEKSGKPLGSEASPPFSNPKEVIPDGEKADAGNQTVENFLNETRKMNDAEFVHKMVCKKKETIVENAGEKNEFDPTLTCQFSGRKVVPAFYEVAKYMAHMLPQNESARRTFLRELKGVDGGLSSLINEVFGHKECYGEIVNAMGTPESVVPRRLARAMNESYTNWMTEMGMPNMNSIMGGATGGIAGSMMSGSSSQKELSLNPMKSLPNPMSALSGGNTSGMGELSLNPMSSLKGMGNPLSAMKGMGEAVDLPIDQRLGMDDESDELSDDDAALSSGPPVPPDQPTDVVPPIRGGMPNIGPPMGGGMGGGMSGAPGAPPDMSAGGGMPGGDMSMAPPENTPPGMAGPEQPAGAVSTPNPQQNRPVKEFAYHHLAREMVKYDNMKNVLREILGG